MRDEKIWAAVHESAHAVATVLMFQQAEWLPGPAPLLPVKYVEIEEHAYGEWGGNCFGSNIYNSNADCYRSQAYRDLMERQVVIELAGGVAESMYRDAPIRDCCAEIDRKKAATVLADLYFLTNVRHTEEPYVERTRQLVQRHWYIVKRLATALAEEEFIDGNRVNWFCEHFAYRR